MNIELLKLILLIFGVIGLVGSCTASWVILVRQIEQVNELEKERDRWELIAGGWEKVAKDWKAIAEERQISINILKSKDASNNSEVPE